MARVQLRVVLLLMAQGAMLFAFFSAKTQVDVRSAYFASLIFGGLLACLLAWATTRTSIYFIRKLVALLILFWLFSVCFSLIPALKLSDQALNESGEWGPMAPEVISAPLALLASVAGSLAMISLWWLTSIVEPPDPD
jgi:hypothetical protein